jgi:hypothetical protein
VARRSRRGWRAGLVAATLVLGLGLGGAAMLRPPAPVELYNDDPERADYLVFGRKSGLDRRGFLRGAGLASMGAVLGTTIPFSANMPSGLIPAALAESVERFQHRIQARRHDRAQ